MAKTSVISPKRNDFIIGNFVELSNTKILIPIKNTSVNR